MIDDILKNRKHVLEFTDEVPSKELIDSLLQRTWKVTPSKNNFMAYTIHVVTDKDKRKAIYNMCISNEKQLNDDNVRYLALYLASVEIVFCLEKKET